MRSYQRATDLTKFHSSAGVPAEWGGSIPNTGTLTFDYLTHKDPPEGVKVATFNQLTAALEACGVTFARGGGRAVLPAGASTVTCSNFEYCRVDIEHVGQPQRHTQRSVRRSYCE